jgi:hypothetical protein
MGKVRIVLTEKQKTVLGRMKRVQRVTGEVKERLQSDPGPIFDGIAGDVELPYSDRVIGIGEYEFVSVPKATSDEGAMSDLFGDIKAAEASSGQQA